MRKQIIIEDYSPQWPVQFEMLKSVYAGHLEGLVNDIQHVGSTAVPGLSAKPVIDIDLVIENSVMPLALLEKLQALGYEYVGDMGIKDREAFRRKSSLTPINGSGLEWPAHNLYVCISDSISLRNHLTLRDFLRANPAKAKEYGTLKKSLAGANPYDIDLYIKNKTPFIVEVLALKGFDEVSLNRIRKDNGAE